MSTNDLDHWESVEVQRSAVEADIRKSEDLRIDDAIIQRYANPPADTMYYLEYSYHLLGDVKGLTVLDYGCGTGDNCVHIAHRGGNAVGIDISPELLELARARMKLHDFTENTEFRLGSAHRLPFDDETVDVVFGIAILHHLDLESSASEVYRVLKKGGRAIFQEPVRNSKVIKFIRNLIPYEQPDLSPYERPLTDKELKHYAKNFSGYKSREFSLPFVNLMGVLGLPEGITRPAQKLDRALLNNIGLLRRYASVQVVEMTK
ncbi:MAG: class I SAM-dependent methyltransferase [Alcanivoracaceae bacterium]|jgi:SAM-dependent methyltransferase|nr:class I SAM-dependent methyltransferase [Alcanivoracaceae bacterium]